jgi:CRISPR system Cascade subunit CasD
MVSWGEVAVGGERRSALHPSRSAIIGLLGAALGIDRFDSEAQKGLNDSVAFGVKVLSGGDILKDYHTSQVPKADRKVSYLTRRDELKMNPDAVGTILSSREYRTDSLSIVSLWQKNQVEDVKYSLKVILGALNKPVFHLYLGRKSCPIAAPLQAQIVEADSLKSALDESEFYGLRQYQSYKNQENSIEDRRLLRVRRIWENQEGGDKKMFFPVSYHWENCSHAGMDTEMQSQRYDEVIDRKRWQFAPRKENMAYAREVAEYVFQ